MIWGLRGPVFSQTWVISETYFCELVLGFLPDRIQTTAEMFSGKWILIIIEKKLTFPLNIAMGPQNVRKSRAMFTKKNYSSWTKWDILTKLDTHVNDKDLWSKKNKCADLPVGGAKNSKKLFQGNRWSDRLEIWYTVSLFKGEQKTIWTFAYLKKHGRHWSNKFKHLLDKVNRGQSERNSVGMFHSLF